MKVGIIVDDVSEVIIIDQRIIILLNVLNLGEVLQNNSVASRAMKEKKTLIENIHRSVYA